VVATVASAARVPTPHICATADVVAPTATVATASTDTVIVVAVLVFPGHVLGVVVVIGAAVFVVAHLAGFLERISTVVFVRQRSVRVPRTAAACELLLLLDNVIAVTVASAACGSLLLLDNIIAVTVASAACESLLLLNNVVTVAPAVAAASIVAGRPSRGSVLRHLASIAARISRICPCRRGRC
jgi:hypothetical protein